MTGTVHATTRGSSARVVFWAANETATLLNVSMSADTACMGMVQVNSTVFSSTFSTPNDVESIRLTVPWHLEGDACSYDAETQKTIVRHTNAQGNKLGASTTATCRFKS